MSLSTAQCLPLRKSCRPYLALVALVSLAHQPIMSLSFQPRTPMVTSLDATATYRTAYRSSSNSNSVDRLSAPVLNSHSSTGKSSSENNGGAQRVPMRTLSCSAAGSGDGSHCNSTCSPHLNGQQHIDLDLRLSEPTGVGDAAKAQKAEQMPRQRGPPAASTNNGSLPDDRARAKSSPAPSTIAVAPVREPRPAGSTNPTLVPRSLDSVRGSLIRQEETIIFSLIEREQFRQNPVIYTDRTFRLDKDGVQDIYGRDASFLEFMLCETEKLHARVRRYMSLEELAFFPTFLPEPILPRLDFPRLLAPNDVNLNREILARYVSEVVPTICEPGDDAQHGSSIVCDVNALQAISRRVHLGKFVAESKFQADGKTYQDLCRAGDVHGVNKLLTNKAVEKKVLQRAYMKASTYGRDVNDMSFDASKNNGAAGCVSEEGGPPNFKVDPQIIADLYRNFIIPLTKDVEILYLFERTGYPCPSLQGIHDRG